LPFTTQAGVHVSEHHSSGTPCTCLPCAAAHAIIASAREKSQLPRDGSSSSIFVALSGVYAS